MASDAADRFRKQAEECRQKAEQAINALDKVAWVRFAVEWVKLAQSAEEIREMRDAVAFDPKFPTEAVRRTAVPAFVSGR